MQTFNLTPFKIIYFFFHLTVMSKSNPTNNYLLLTADLESTRIIKHSQTSQIDSKYLNKQDTLKQTTAITDKLELYNTYACFSNC